MLNRCYGYIMCTAFLTGLVAQVYMPVPDWHIYFLECSVFAAWLIADALERRANFTGVLAYTAASVLLAPLVIPRWYACRPLKPGEWRKGGLDTNYFLAFAAVTLFFTGVSAACNFLNFGPERGFELIINSGFCVSGLAVLMAMLSRKESVFEKGPAALPSGAEEAE